MDQNSFYLGVDLGQRHDPTALAAVERVVQRSRSGSRHLSASYAGFLSGPRCAPAQAGHAISGDRRRSGQRGTDRCRARPDHAGSGRNRGWRACGRSSPRQLDSTIPLIPVIFTGGDTARHEDGIYRVPKKDLVHGLMVLFENQQLRLLDDHAETRALVNELSNMRVKISGESHASYEAWRNGQHDDLLFALALACWRGRWSAPKPLGVQKPLILW